MRESAEEIAPGVVFYRWFANMVAVKTEEGLVLRYLADSVLSVPPGGGRIRSMALTAGLRMLRYRGSWLLAVALRAGGVVQVRRPG